MPTFDETIATVKYAGELVGANVEDPDMGEEEIADLRDAYEVRDRVRAALITIESRMAELPNLAGISISNVSDPQAWRECHALADRASVLRTYLGTGGA